MVAQILCGAPDPLGKSLSGARIVSCNVILRFNQIGKCGTRPAEFQVFTPQRAKALRTSSTISFLTSIKNFVELRGALPDRADALDRRGVGIVIGRIPRVRRQVRQVLHG